jgi:hypothetical protein
MSSSLCIVWHEFIIGASLNSSLCVVCNEFIFVLRLSWVHHCASSIMSSSLCFLRLSGFHRCASSVMISSFVLRLWWVRHCASSVMSLPLCFVCDEFIFVLRLSWVYLSASSVMSSSLCFVCHEFIIVLRLLWVHHVQALPRPTIQACWTCSNHCGRSLCTTRRRTADRQVRYVLKRQCHEMNNFFEAQTWISIFSIIRHQLFF